MYGKLIIEYTFEEDGQADSLEAGVHDLLADVTAVRVHETISERRLTPQDWNAYRQSRNRKKKGG